MTAAPGASTTAGPHRLEINHRHRDVSGGWLRPAVFGAMDGLVTNVSLIAGVGGGGAQSHLVVLTGLAGLVAGAFSMATGEFISVSSQNEAVEAEVDIERRELHRAPEQESAELAEAFVRRGVDRTLAEQVAHQIGRDPEEALRVHAREELGIDPEELPSPWTAAGASFACFAVGALLPLLPYLAGAVSLTATLAVSGVAAFAGGALVSRVTSRGWLFNGLRQLAVGILAAGATFLVGHAIGAHVS